MLTRSRRPDIHNSTTTAEVGPGAYDSATSSIGALPRNAVAPFGSTSHRSGFAAVDVIPGPGAYFKDTLQGSAAKALSRPSAQFASKQARIPVERSQIESQNLPGPGAYTGDIVGEPKRPTGRPSSGKNMHAAHGINWVKVATAPSIPTVQQSYGYEEGPNGTLVLQSTPYRGHTGVGFDKPGPGEYVPSDRLVKPARHAPNFGAQAGGRHSPVSKDASVRPGPGSYDFAACGTSDAFKGGVMAQRQSSSFASVSKRSTLPTATNAPGPGAYRAPSNFVSLREHLAANPDSHQAFGRSVSDHASKKEDFGVPGPGDYDPKLEPFAAPGAKSTSVFASKQQRFAGSAPSNTVPGPGTYAVTDISMVNELHSKIKGRFGAFGSTSGRFAKSDQSAGDAGPGSYNPPASLPNPSEARRKDKRSSGFRSTSKRSDVAASGACEAAFYNPPSDWPKPASTSRAFITNQPRFPGGRHDEAPGPGEYNPTLLAKKPAGVGSDQGRSTRFQGTRVDENPGPGTYNTIPSMVRRTFNISIGA